MKRILVVSLLVLVVLVKLPSCKKLTNEYETFTIKKGNHRSTTRINRSLDTVFNWSILFDSSAIYNTVDSLNQRDVNKLIGWSDCGTRHTENSIRFGWRWLDNSLQILWFKHEHGDFSFGIIDSVSLCEPHIYELNIWRWNYGLCVDGKCVYVNRNCPVEDKKYMLYPYFGGDETAPHDIKIQIKKR